MPDNHEIKEVMRLARLRCEQGLEKKYPEQIRAILDDFQVLTEADVDNVDPLYFVSPSDTGLRKDRVETSSPWPEQLLSNATHLKDGFYRVPRVLP